LTADGQGLTICKALLQDSGALRQEDRCDNVSDRGRLRLVIFPVCCIAGQLHIALQEWRCCDVSSRMFCCNCRPHCHTLLSPTSPGFVDRLAALALLMGGVSAARLQA
jgi:hypothetical protein